MRRATTQVYEFGPFRIDVAERLLLRDGQVVPLTPRVFDTLLVLIENSGHILTKDEVIKRVWTDSIVEEASLAKNISTLRKALGETPDENRYIETIPWRGYRFVAGVREVGDGIADLIVEERTRSRVLIEQEQETSGLAVEAALESTSIHLPSAPDNESERVSKRRTSLVVLVICIALTIAITAIVLLLTRKDQPSRPPVITSIAVLPLENLSGDPAQEYFADGMTEALINNLARIRAVRVISRASVMRYKGSRKALPEIARELNADAVVTGSVQRSGGRVRVTAQLIDAVTDAHLWAGDYESHLTEVLKLEGEVARAVADEIRVQVTAEERARLASGRTVDPQAHEAYLLGRHHFSKGNEQGWKQAIAYFERATQIAPDYAAAYAGLSDAWQQRGGFGANFKEAGSISRAAALKAVELDEQLAEAHSSVAIIKFIYDWDWTGAEREFRRALELDPGSLRAHSSYGTLLMALGRHDEAIREGRIAVQLDPVSPGTQSALGWFLYRARRYDEALSHLERAVELEPQSARETSRLGIVYAQLGRYDEAIAAIERIKEMVSNGEDIQATGLAYVYALMGRRREARQMISGVETNTYGVAIVYATLGDNDDAFRILGKAVEERLQPLVTLKEDPPFENLHSDPRWKPLLRRMNFPPE